MGLSRGRNARAIWQDLVSEYGFASSYQSVQRFVRKRRGTQTPEARVVIVTAPGQEAQVDYGTGPMVRDPESRKYRRTRLFVMTLGCSRKSVRLLTFRSSSRIWAELHERAFRRLGGATRIVVLDNLREGVLVPDIYDPALNPLYRDVLAHYGAVAMPCRIQDPDRKGKVESGVGHAQKTPLKGLRFETLEEAQAYLDHWEQRWADTRIHGTTKRQVAAMFAEEKPTLLPLPLEPFRYYQYGIYAPVNVKNGKEGYRGWCNGMALMKHLSGKKLDAAYEYLNWYLSGWQGAFVSRYGYYSPTPSTAKKFMTDTEWAYWYEGKPAPGPISDPYGVPMEKAGAMRDGGSFVKRVTNISCCNTLMDEAAYMNKRWNDFKVA